LLLCRFFDFWFITAYGYDCRSSGSINIAKQKATKPVALATSDATKSVFWTDDMDYPHGSATSWAETVGYDGKGLHHGKQSEESVHRVMEAL